MSRTTASSANKKRQTRTVRPRVVRVLCESISILSILKAIFITRADTQLFADFALFFAPLREPSTLLILKIHVN
ncbi:MAG: hypothetical protein AUG51_03945 [Acidobacteria bacterium 13_1_20CM_3_53_8]|nr:MAG: hypothetical protein AUG51_03945 [Acidobacteria bacterium 13_1_20CM_3_53_8]